MPDPTISNLIPFLPLIPEGLAAIVGLRFLFIHAPLPLRKLAQLWLILFLVEVFGHVMRLMSIENEWYYNLWHFFFFFFLSRIFIQLLKSENTHVVIQIFLGAFIVFFVMNSLFFQGLFQFQTLTYVVGGVFMIVLAGMYFWELFVSTDNDKITRDPFFWMSFALIVYYGATVPFYGMFNYLHTNFYDFTVFYSVYISNAFSIFLNIIVMVAFLCRKNYPKSF